MKQLFKLLLLTPALLPGFSYAACELKADTSGTLVVGPFYDATDGVTAETGLTVEDGDVLWQQPGSTTIAEETGFSDCTHRAGGYYTCPYDTTVVDTEGTASYVVNESGALPVFEKCLVLGADFYDLKYGTTATITSRDVGLQFEGTISTVNSQTSLDLSGGASNNDAYNDYVACIVGGTEEDCVRIEDYVASGNVLTLSEAMSFTVASSDVIRIHPPGFASVSGTVDANMVSVSGDSTAADNIESAYDGTGYDVGGIDVSELNTAVDAVGSDGTGLTEAGGTGDQLTAVATASAVTTVDGNVDAIKAKTDSLTFTNSGEVDANTKSINDVTVTGDGSSGNKWGN